MNNSIELYSNGQYTIKFQSTPPKQSYLELNQTHSSHISDIESLGKISTGEDGIIFDANETNIIAIKTADCFPICYIGKNQIGLIHAGWRGVKSEIYLSSKLKKIKPLSIIIGPSICDSCFEVSDDFRQEFPDQQNYFVEMNKKLFYQLKSFVKNQLQEHFPYSQIRLIHDCTLCNQKWHSYRRDKTTNRNFTVFQKQ